MTEIGHVPDAGPVGLPEVVAEVADAARRAREDGAHPPALDRELDETYRRLVRHRPGDDRLTQAIWSADAAAHVTADAGLGETQGTAKRFVKRVLAKLVRWYVLRITTQVTAFANAAVSALRLLSDRVEALAEEVEAARPPSLPGRAALTTGRGAPPPAGPLETHAPFGARALEVLTGAPGRVLHADCRSGELVARLSALGVDAYGVEPVGSLVDRPVAAGLDLVQGEVLAHLRTVPTHGLGGALLSGCVDRLSGGDARRLAFLLSTRLAAGGSAVLVGTHPATWRLEASPVERDLSPGRPLHPETWCHLLEEYGFSSCTVVDGPEQAALASLPAELDVVRQLLGGPASYLVTASRSR